MVRMLSKVLFSLTVVYALLHKQIHVIDFLPFCLKNYSSTLPFSDSQTENAMHAVTQQHSQSDLAIQNVQNTFNRI